jgi:hypothetical protein
MKKTSITVRVPIFFDVDLELDDVDYESLLEEWDRSNFGRVRAILEEYVDLDSMEVMGTEERFGDPEVVDIRIFDEQCVEDVEDTTEDFGYTTIAPKGKPN